MKEMAQLFLPPIFFKLQRVPLFLKGKIVYKNVNFREELAKQISEIPEISKLFPEERIKQLYVSHMVRDTVDNPDVYITQLRFYWYYNYFKKNYSDMFEKNTTILDVGGASGLFLDSINKKGTVLDTNKECINFLKKKGIKAIYGNAECIDLPDKSFDYVVAFQCLEHMPNPLIVLNEFGRVAKKKVFISIPFKEKTEIYSLDYWRKLKKESWKMEKEMEIGDGHIFEFSTEDFKKLLSYTNLIYENNIPIYYFDDNTPYRRHYNNYRGSYFNFFVLKNK